jgi:SAM-dependent methyltransferase
MLWEICNELLLNIRTRSEQQLVSKGKENNAKRPWWRGPRYDKAKYDDNNVYATPDYWYIYKIFRILNPGNSDIIYDIGSGKGRFLCVAARKRIKKCVGIELFESLSEIAKQNACRLRRRKAPIDIFCMDASVADYSDGTIFFMFNPFGKDTLRDTLKNIERSIIKNHRKIVIVYYNDVHKDILESLGWLSNYYSFNTFISGLNVSFWRN